MKLRNKKTGEIGELSVWHRADNNELTGFAVIKEGEKFPSDYKNLDELNAEWEDYEEPKDFWYIDDECGVMCDSTDPNLWDKKYAIDFMQQIGNYFGTREEAEKAVEKLKAWKRLKDAGGEFYGWRRNQTGTYELYMRWEDRIPRNYEVKKDLELLFGGEE